MGGSKTLFGAHVASPNFAPNPRSSQPLLMKEADLHLHRTAFPGNCGATTHVTTGTKQFGAASFPRPPIPATKTHTHSHP